MTRSSTANEYRSALNEVVARVQDRLRDTSPASLPVRMYIAGGAALHLLTGERVTEDIDATFSRKILLGEEIEVSYRDADGRARLMYLDRNYNDSLGLLHEDAYANSLPVVIPGTDPKLIEVRVLSPVDLAVSKLARFADQDRQDIELLARKGLLDADAVRDRAEEALQGYVGNPAPLRTSIDIACRLIAERAPRHPGKARRP